jgi:hypothetical protein
MPSLLTQLPRLLRRAAQFSLAATALLVMAAATGTTEPREGSAEESVHVAAAYANALNKWLAVGADDTDADAAHPACDAFSFTPAPRQATGLRPNAAVAPSAPDGAPGAARAPPVLG